LLDDDCDGTVDETTDLDGDARGDACDPDDDNDGIGEVCDPTPQSPKPLRGAGLILVGDEARIALLSTLTQVTWTSDPNA
jgi:hypothetical protein